MLQTYYFIMKLSLADYLLTGGQSSTGSVLSWARRSLFAPKSGNRINDESKMPTYQELDIEASKVSVGADGLIALETFQGSAYVFLDIVGLNRIKFMFLI